MREKWEELAAWEKGVTSVVAAWSLAALGIYGVAAVDVLGNIAPRLSLPWWAVLLTDLAVLVWVRFLFRGNLRSLRIFGWYFWIAQVWFPVPMLAAAVLGMAQAPLYAWFELLIGPEAIITALLWAPVLRLYQRIKGRIDARKARQANRKV